MTFHGVQMLYVSNGFGNPTELINGARTAARLRSAAVCGTFAEVMESAGCEALALQPCTMDETGETAAWEPADFSPDTAPWNDDEGEYLNAGGAAEEAFGFYIEEWTGLDGAHHGRSTTGVGMTGGGAYFGPMSHSHRVMKLNVLLLGSSVRGINYLFRWLEQTLLSCCGAGDRSIWLREFCPPDPYTDPEDGFARIPRTVLLEGPTWESDPHPNAGNVMRRASFTLGAGDPCMYGQALTVEPMDLGADYVAASEPGDVTDPLYPRLVAPDGYWLPPRSFRQPITSTLWKSRRKYGKFAPRVTITSPLQVSAAGERLHLPDLRISGFTDPAGLNKTRAQGGDMRKIGEFILSGRGTSGLEIVVDLAERSVKYRDLVGAPDNWRDGARLIGRPLETHLRRWWSFDRNDDGVISIEPVYLSLYNSTAQSYLNSAPMKGVTFDVELVSRFGCC